MFLFLSFANCSRLNIALPVAFLLLFWRSGCRPQNHIFLVALKMSNSVNVVAVTLESIFFLMILRCPCVGGGAAI